MNADSPAKAFDSLLAPYAILHKSGLGRVHSEDEDETRLRFQRDRGRIVHTQAFRRLKGKTQVFVGGGGDHYRTRLTHTLEVAGISRDIARTLRLNEDLAECIALAHDLGHPPFGHAGESAMNTWMQEHDSGFEHNLQSHRIVTVLEDHSSLYLGLNLNQEVLDGLLKHSTPHDHPQGVTVPRSPSLEAQAVNIADEIAYTAHDCEDGLQAGLFTLNDIASLPLIAKANELRSSRATSLRGAVIHLLVMDLYEATKKNISSYCINTLDDVYTAEHSCVRFSEEVRSDLDAVRQFLWDNMYNHPEVLKRSQAGQTIIRSLCEALYAQPNDKVQELQQKTEGALNEAVKDYISGMTDSYAFLQTERLGVMGDQTADILGHH